jgi:cardiolipin synthase (CMP-forming)
MRRVRALQKRMTARDLPNILTALRLILAVGVYAALAAAFFAGDAHARAWLAAALLAFVVASVTDYFDGMLARRFDAVSPWGAMLDPIADKIAVAAVVVGLAPLWPATAVPGALILFREVLVSGLRETGASRGLRFPVTRLAKWKTTVQLAGFAVAIGALLIPPLAPAALGLLWLAAALTWWTGGQYVAAARAQLKG